MATRKAKSEHYPLIPEEERKCVWMATGLISYKLCDRNYQCEECHFDQAIKHQESNVQGVNGDWAVGSSHPGDSTGRINGSLFYHPEHCWVKVENCDTARIGIDDLLTQLIAKVKVIILPEVGTFTARGDCFAHIMQEDHILPVTAPLSGVVQAVNPRLKNEPELVTGDPSGDGWLITIKPDHLEDDLKNLLFGRGALAWYQGQEQEIVARSEFLLRQDCQELGPTMQDGGVVMNSLGSMLKIMNPLQRTQILDFSINKLKGSHLAGDDKIKSEFVALIAHELRAPVAAVAQQLSVILGNMAGELNEAQKQLVSRAKDRTQGILQLIRDLLDLSKAEAGEMARHGEPLSLIEVIDNAVKMMETEAEQKNIHIECFHPSSLALVRADYTAMQSLFTNLISNAVKYTGAGGKVKISLGDQGNFVKMTVTDTGVGINKEDLPRIFDKFYRVKSPATRHIIGTGLGLAIVKNIVDDHQGTIVAESELGKGTTFSVILPKVQPR